MQDLIAKASTLLEALPYIQKFSGETFVVKYGGSFMDSPDESVRTGVARDIVFLEAVEINPVVVHGGGKAITRAMEKAGLKANFIQGQRVTDEATAQIVDDPEAKALALAGVVDRFYPGRAATLRPNDPQEIKAVTVIGMRIEEASAKVRAKNVVDDEEDYALPIWAGVVGVKTVIGGDDPCPRLPPDVARPDNLSAYTQGRVLDDVFLEMQRLYERDSVD